MAARGTKGRGKGRQPAEPAVQRRGITDEALDVLVTAVFGQTLKRVVFITKDDSVRTLFEKVFEGRDKLPGKDERVSSLFARTIEECIDMCDKDKDVRVAVFDESASSDDAQKISSRFTGIKIVRSTEKSTADGLYAEITGLLN